MSGLFQEESARAGQQPFVVTKDGVERVVPPEQAVQKVLQPTSVSVDTTAQAKEALANSVLKDTKSNSTDTRHVAWSCEQVSVGDLQQALQQQQQAIQSVQGEIQQMQAMMQHFVTTVPMTTSAYGDVVGWV